MTRVSRADVLGFRVRAQQLDRTAGALADTAVLDIGVQDSGPDGGRWALAIRGLTEVDTADLVLLWTLRGAPHLYRRADVASVAAAVAPFSDADAGKRIFDASKPLKTAGIGHFEALDAVAAAMRAIVTRPTVKGEVSTRLTAAMPQPYLRHCRPCATTHVYEMPFRLAAVRAGLELQPDTSPRRCSHGSPASARRRGRRRATTSYGRTCGSWVRRRRSTSPASSTRRWPT